MLNCPDVKWSSWRSVFCPNCGASCRQPAIHDSHNPTIPGYKIKMVLGIVTGLTPRTRSFGKQFIAESNRCRWRSHRLRLKSKKQDGKQCDRQKDDRARANAISRIRRGDIGFGLNRNSLILRNRTAVFRGTRIANHLNFLRLHKQLAHISP